MEIKDGYNGEPMELRISSSSNGSIELWLKGNLGGKKDEILIYLTVQELFDLYGEVKDAGKKLFDSP